MQVFFVNNGYQMVKIIRYEVYTDRGSGWNLVEQFASDERQNAAFCAKEIEENGYPVKVIREIYETDDGLFQETVEYVGGLKNKTKSSAKTLENELFDDLSGEYNVEATPLKMLASNEVSKAILKLVMIVFFSLVLANILTTLSVPLVELWVPEEKRKTVLFFGFFAVFIMFSAPLLWYKVPWNVFYSLHKDEKELINERKFFRRAANLMNNYNLNDNGREVIVPVFPEASLEYKQYIIEYLSQVLNNLDTKIKLSDGYNRLGVELVIYGGCLELSRYGRLSWAEANSLLYEAFKVLEGDSVDLQVFYDAKRTYGDNKVAVFLTGVGAYLMSQVINDIPMDARVLSATVEKWVSFNTKPETSTEISENTDTDSNGINIIMDCLVNIKMDINIFDDEKEIGEEENNKVRNDIRNVISAQVIQHRGQEAVEDGNITSVRFSNLGKAVGFIDAFREKIENYKDDEQTYNLMIDNKIVLVEVPADKTINLNTYISDILDFAYNSEVIVNSVIKDELLDSHYAFEFLGDKQLKQSGQTVALYKMLAA